MRSFYLVAEICEGILSEALPQLDVAQVFRDLVDRKWFSREHIVYFNGEVLDGLDLKAERFQFEVLPCKFALFRRHEFISYAEEFLHPLYTKWVLSEQGLFLSGVQGLAPVLACPEGKTGEARPPEPVCNCYGNRDACDCGRVT